MLEKKKEVRKSESVKSVPGVVVSAKFIMQDKKNLKVKDQDGKERKLRWTSYKAGRKKEVARRRSYPYLNYCHFEPILSLISIAGLL
jgi:hypothetical protein